MPRLGRAQPFAPIIKRRLSAPPAYAVSASASVVLVGIASQATLFVYSKSAAASLVLTATGSCLHQVTVTSTASVVVTATASQATLFVYQKTALASVILTATGSVHHAVPVSGSASLILTATGAVRFARSVLATASVTLLVDASAVRAIARDSALRVILRVRARVPGQTSPSAGDDYLGRYQQGQEVPLEIQCFQPKGIRALPDMAPVARMYRDGALVGSQVLSVNDDGPGRFGFDYLIGVDSEPGLYAVCYWYQTGIVVRSQWQVFEVVPGGDMAGPVIAATVLERPDGDQVLAQFGSGVLAVGRDPYIDEGVT